MDIKKYITVSESSRIPKYQQIVDSIIDNIAKGNLKINDKIPSINTFSEEYLISRDTVEKAYNILKKNKVIISIKGKGNYIARTQLISKTNVLFLVNKMSNYKMKIYYSFIAKLGMNYHVDLQIYHCDESLFLNILSKSIGGYNYYIIMPHFKTNDFLHASKSDNVSEILGKIPTNKLIVLDNLLSIHPNHSEIFQDFENDIYYALTEAFDKIKKYNKLIFFFPEKSVYPYPRRILYGFQKFCGYHSLDFEILNQVYKDMTLKKGDLFIVIEESDLVLLIKQIRKSNLILGKDIGVISYNETPLKDLLGITVISTDFKKMGRAAAKMILKNTTGKIKNPFNLIDRNSI